MPSSDPAVLSEDLFVPGNNNEMDSSLLPLESTLNSLFLQDDCLFDDHLLNSLDNPFVTTLSPLSLHLDSHHNSVCVDEVQQDLLSSLKSSHSRSHSYYLDENHNVIRVTLEDAEEEKKENNEGTPSNLEIPSHLCVEQKEGEEQWSGEPDHHLLSVNLPDPSLAFACTDEVLSEPSSCENTPDQAISISLLPTTNGVISNGIRSISLPPGLFPTTNSLLPPLDPLWFPSEFDLLETNDNLPSSMLQTDVLPSPVGELDYYRLEDPTHLLDYIVQVKKEEKGRDEKRRHEYIHEYRCKHEDGVGWNEWSEQDGSLSDSLSSTYCDREWERKRKPTCGKKVRERTNHTWEETAMDLQLPISCGEMSNYLIPDQWLSAEEYYDLLTNMEKNCALFPFYDLGTDLHQVTFHPTFIYEKPCPAIYFLRCEHLKNGKPMFGFPRIKNLSKLYTWKKQGFTTAIPKKNPLVRYITANCYLCGKEKHRVSRL